MTLAYLMGYRNLHLLGYDSCYLYGQRNVNRPPRETLLTLEVNEKQFQTNTEFAAQADEFQDVIATMPEARIKVYGPGLLAEICKGRKEKGCQICV